MNRGKLFKKWFSKSNKNWSVNDFNYQEIMQNEKANEANIFLFMGGRERGKSFRITAELLADAWYENIQLAYVRRYEADTTPTEVYPYFSNHCKFIEDMTDGKYNNFLISRKNIFLINTEDDSIISKIVGHIFSLSKVERVKSQQFPRIGRLLFEEVFTSERYLNHEYENFVSLFSTVLERRKDFRTYAILISNLTSRINPYVQSLAMSNFNRMKAGDIDFYRIERKGAYDDDGNQKYFKILVFYLQDKIRIKENAKDKKSNVGNYESNTWLEGKAYSCIDYEIYKKYKIDIPPVVLYVDNGKFLLTIIELPNENILKLQNEMLVDIHNQNTLCVYVTRKTTDIHPNTRLYTNHREYLPRYNAIDSLEIQYNIDKLYINMIEARQILFSDNLTANEFMQCLNKLRMNKFNF